MSMPMTPSSDSAPTKPAPGSTRTWLYAAVFVPLLLGLLAACSLLVDYTRTSAVFCNDEGSGCNAVRQSVYAHIGGIPTPVFGVAGFALLVVLATLEGERVRKLFLAIAAIGAIVALGLIGVQAKLQHFCVYCMVTDVSSLTILAIAGVRLAKRWELPRAGATNLPFIQIGAVCLTILGAGATLVFGYLKPLPPPPPQGSIPVPDWVKQEIASTPKGSVLIVDFVDFECPFCREMHANLLTAVRSTKINIRVIRKHVPLRMHPHAEGAARACICAEAQGKGEAMADALIDTKVENLEPATYKQLAEKFGLDAAKFAGCTDSAETTARLDADKATFKAAGGRGLPLLFIGPERSSGLIEAADAEALLKAGN